MTINTQALHTEYNRLTGLNIPFTMSRHYQWEQWSTHGQFTLHDLAPVVGYLQRRIREKKRQPESLLFRNMIGNYDNFAEDLSMARSEQRTYKPTNRDRVLAATGRSVTVTHKPKTPGEVLAESQALEQFRAWRKESGL